MRGLYTEIENSKGADISFARRWASWSDLLADSQEGGAALKKSDGYDRLPLLDRRGERRSKFHFGSIAKAAKAAEYGWADGTKKLLNGVDKIADRIGEIADTMTPVITYDVGGELPDVGLYCAGVPEHMLSWPVQEATAPVVRLGINLSKAWVVTEQQCVNFGASVVALIDALELAGRDVELTVYEAGEGYNAKRVQYVVLKAAGEQIDRDRLAYALVSLDMLRRTFMATLGADQRMIYSCYGTPIPLTQVPWIAEHCPELVDVHDVDSLAGLTRSQLGHYNDADAALDLTLQWAKDEGLLNG